MTVTAIPQTATGAPVDEKAKGTGKDKGTAKPKSKKKLIMIIVAILAIGGGGYTFLAPKPVGPPVPGTVVPLDPIQINLAGSHYLRLGVALQLITGVQTEDGSKAMDSAIEIFSGLPMAEVNNTQKRGELKKMLLKQLDEKYKHEVMGVYFTEFVTQ